MIYISGKIGGLPILEASKKFAKAEQDLRHLGLKVINPMNLGISHWTYDEQIAKCLEVIENHATAIYLLSDWKDSKGAKLEFAHVGALNQSRRPQIDIYYEEMGQMADIETDIKAGLLTCLVPEL